MLYYNIMIKLVVDSTFYLPKEFCEKHDIRVVPLVLRLDGVEYSEGYPGEFQPFFDKVTVGKSFPQTACPAPEDFKRVFTEILNEGHEVLSLCLSSGLSGAYDSARLASEQIGGDKITVYDTRLALAALRYIVDKALGMIEAGLSRAEIIAPLPGLVSRSQYACFPININYLVKGGRVKGLAAIIGKLARIRPIIGMKDSLLVSEKKVLTQMSGESYMMAKIEAELKDNNLEKYYFAYAYDDKYLQAFKKKVLERFPELAEISEDYEIGPVIGIHLGPYSYGHMIITKK